MSCREFETGIDAFLRGWLGADDARALERHAAECDACSELLELAHLPVEDPPGLAALVLGRTSGTACRKAEERLPDFVDGALPADGDRELLAEHLEHCVSCSGLATELEWLAVELPRLAIVRPGKSLVEGVLRRTLPASVLLRRWWAATWPCWIRRPRFASELAYVVTLFLVLLFGTPVSPFQAMPGRAVELARNVPLDRLAELSNKVGEGAQNLSGSTRQTVGTILKKVASWFEEVDDESQDNTTPTIEKAS